MRMCREKVIDVGDVEGCGSGIVSALPNPNPAFSSCGSLNLPLLPLPENNGNISYTLEIPVLLAMFGRWGAISTGRQVVVAESC